MPKQIIWSPLAENDFDGILAYLEENWNTKVVNKFLDITEKYLALIAINLNQYPLIYLPKKIRKCVLTKHNLLFYREKKQQVEFLRIYDTRQDPIKLKFT